MTAPQGEPYPFDPGVAAPALGISLPPVKPRHPLGLPAGSVRAFLTFMILGTFWALLLMPKEKDIHIPLYLLYLVLLVVCSYFSARSHSPRNQEWSPLFLPRGSVRLLIILGFAAVMGYGWYKDQSFFDNIKFEQVASQPFLPFVLLGTFFLGAVISTMARLILSGPRGLPGWYQDIQAWVSLLAVLGFGFAVIWQLVIRPTTDKPDLPQVQAILAAIISFYFGARS